MVGVNTFLEAMNRSMDTRQVTIETKTLAGGETHDFTTDPEHPKIEDVSYKPDDRVVAKEAIIYTIRPLIASGSTQCALSLYEHSNREDIEQVISVEDLSVNDSVSTFQPGSGTGAQFENQEGEDKWYFTLEENSDNDVKLKVRLRWLDLGDLGP